MSDDNSTPPSAPAASKRKQSRKKLTPDQRIARLEQQLARAKSEQRETSRKLQTRGKIILGAAFLGYLNSLHADKKQRPLNKLIPHIAGRDRQDLLRCGLLPDSVTLDNTGDTEKTDSGSDSSETSEKSGD